MGITIFGRGIPLSAVDDGSTLSVAYNGTALFDITTSGLSGLVQQANSTTLTATTVVGTNISGTTVSATTVSGVTVKAATVTGTTVYATTLCGATAASAVNLACTFGAGNSATLSGTPGTIATCADRFLVMTISGKTYYVPAYASAGTFSAA